MALATTHLISSMLFDLTDKDPTTLLLATAFLLLVAGLAGYLPARQASRLEPIEALRYE